MVHCRACSGTDVPIVMMREEERAWQDLPCIQWGAYRNPYGYGKIHRLKTHQQLASRWVWELFHGQIPAGLCVLHRCDNPSCVRPQHLWLGTLSENNHDRDDKGHGVHPAGESHYKSKLTHSACIEIRSESALIKSGLSAWPSIKSFAEHFGASHGVSWQTVRSVVYGMNWRNA